MNTLKTIFLCLSLSYFPVLKAQIPVHVQHGCFAEKGPLADESYVSTFQPSDEALKLVEYVVEAAGVPANFELRFADVSGLIATADQGKRYLLYSNRFLRQLDKKNTYWGAYFMLAHEIAHHLKKHRLEESDPSLLKYNELDADVFAGSALRMFGASLTETQQAVKATVLTTMTKSRPSLKSRQDAVSLGWNRLDQKLDGELYEHPVSADYFKLRKPETYEVAAEYSTTTVRPQSISDIPQPVAYSSKSADKYASMPDFPWPPPNCYQRKTIFKKLLEKGQNFEDIDERLVRVLDKAQYYQRSYYQTPGGFALVTQMEQFEPDGKIKNRFRWHEYPVNDDFKDVWSYLKSLVMPEPGRFRIFAFIVTNEAYPQSMQASGYSSVAMSLPKAGFGMMASTYSQTEITADHYLEVLVYEFEAPQSTKKCMEKCPAFLDVQTHLLQSGLSVIAGF